MALEELFLETRSLASAAAARRLVALLENDLAANSDASLVVSGGTSPVECFGLLAGTELKWDDVTILMSDERCVPADHEDSNEGMIRRELVSKCAAGATLLPVYRSEMGPDAMCARWSDEIDAMRRPFSASLLGMGEDGHFASLFPDSENISEGLDESNSRLCLSVQTAASPHARISLTLASLLQSVEIVLLIFGDAKREVLEQAKQTPAEYPVARLLQQDQTPVTVIWAP